MAVGIIDPSLNESDGMMVVRGVLDIATIDNLLVDDYQREPLPEEAHAHINEALKSGTQLPDIELGMRGESMKDGKKQGDSYVTLLLDPTYIVDGLQRVTAIRRWLDLYPDTAITLGVRVNLGTDRAWETERFHALNRFRVTVSPNILLYNRRNDSKMLLSFYGLSDRDREFVLHRRVSWKQRMTGKHLIGARTYLTTLGELHAHLAPSRATSVDPLVRAMNAVGEIYGIQAARENARTFFATIDQSWGLSEIENRGDQPQVKGTFLRTLARLFSEHAEFWDDDGRRLVISPSIGKRLSSFSMRDPDVRRLAASSGQAQEIFRTMLVNHINKGTRNGRITPWERDVSPVVSTVEPEKNAEA